jgi:hypothetical protein
VTFVVVVMWLAFAGLCAYIGSEKGRSGGGWFLGGLLFGIFALIAVACVPSRKA